MVKLHEKLHNLAEGASLVSVTLQFGRSAQQEKIMRAQTQQNQEQFAMIAGRLTLEINLKHLVGVALLARMKAASVDEMIAEPCIECERVAKGRFAMMRKIAEFSGL